MLNNYFQKYKRSELISQLKQKKYVVIESFINKDICENSLKKIREYFLKNPKCPSGMGSKDLVRKNSLKYSIGGFNGSQPGISRFMLTLYNPMNDEDIFDFHSSFRKIISFRDWLRGDGRITQDEYLEGPKFNASRFQNYPSGGGFMTMHTDTVGVINSEGYEFLQLLVPLTTRGKDFAMGGAIIKTQDGEIDLESKCKAGDLIIYSGSSMHGVSDIDPKNELHLEVLTGRVIALVTTYS